MKIAINGLARNRVSIKNIWTGWFILAVIVCLPAFGFGQENPHLNMQMNCETCHVAESWHKIRFNHNITKFELTDRHREVDCQSCHNIEDFAKVRSDCFTCHEDVHQAKMGGDCEKCHEPQGWEIFNVEEIHSSSRFPLMGRHTLVDCQSCHRNQQQGDFALLSTECIVCHQQDYLGTENPNHVANSMSTNCQECHEMSDWRPAFLANHDVFFPIFSGEHEGAWSDCNSCHPNQATFLEFTCLRCHEHRQAKMDDEHRGISGYAYESTACLSCHPHGSGEGGIENHDVDFFPIFTGTHQDTWQECSECHVNPETFNVVSCIDCHDHEPVKTNSKHTGMAGYAYETVSCLFCHPSGEKGDFHEHDNLFFPIFAGAHASEWQECAVCHNNPNDRKTFTCLECHEHRQTEMDAKHNGMPGYAYQSSECYFCHPNSDKGQFSDHDNLFFPIFAGVHAGEWNECAECHTNPTNRKEFTCLECHEHRQTEMDAKHNGMPGYAYQSSECYFCHPNSDKGQFSDHDNLFFPIFAGVHAGEWNECAECHTNPTNRKEFTCLECHGHRQTEMDTKHAGIPGYAYQSADCFFCHPDGQKTEFRDHDAQFFPIFAGVHAGEWEACATCHVNPTNRKDFTCLECHDHSRSSMDAKHAGIQGYVYQSTDCFFCHPDGKKGQFRQHDSQFFPIFSGTHAGEWAECAVCHTVLSNRKEFNCLECHEHRQSEMDLKHTGIPGYAYQSADCYLCHPDGRKGEFLEHDNQFFPIFSGPHRNKWDSCATCHFNPNDRKAFTCFDCHEHNRTKMDDKHLREVKDYVYESNACYDCHPNGKGD
ncbi:MAG: hypothetical protein ACE5HS_10760 [bacterium]